MTIYNTTVGDRLHAGLKAEPSGCIVWTRSTTTDGYGRIRPGGRGSGDATTHRVSWELANGPIPDGLLVLHRCDNPPCCNLDHLFLGTPKDNTQDMLRKGRGGHHLRSGEHHPMARLSDAEVEELRQLAPSIDTYVELGRRFGISPHHARDLVLGRKRAA